VLGEAEVDGKTNEIKAIEPLLADLVLDGGVVTVDALLTQRQIAQASWKKGALLDAGEGQPAGFAGSASGVV
jgi:predicted transposase YbfD/YdcC